MLEQFRENLNKRTLKSTQNALRGLNPRTQKAVLRWLDGVEEIRNNPKLSFKERSEAYKQHKTSPVVSSFVKDFIKQIIGRMPGRKNLQKATVRLTRFALPTIMRSESFDPMADLLRKTFPMNQTGDHHIPSPENLLNETPEIQQEQQRIRSKARKNKKDLKQQVQRRPGTRHH